MFFGAHVSASGGIHTTLDRAKAMRADAVQLFTQSPRMWRPTDHDPANLERFRERRAELGIAPGGVVVHAIYLVNLAAPTIAMSALMRAEYCSKVISRPNNTDRVARVAPRRYSD